MWVESQIFLKILRLRDWFWYVPHASPDGRRIGGLRSRFNDLPGSARAVGKHGPSTWVSPAMQGPNGCVWRTGSLRRRCIAARHTSVAGTYRGRILDPAAICKRCKARILAHIDPRRASCRLGGPVGATGRTRRAALVSSRPAGKRLATADKYLQVMGRYSLPGFNDLASRVIQS